ncbi:MAG: hypothetical protein KF687_05525 [Cyclobacteriaceae bacterium]|nr:hypothetical protein [Cyclobacteriaceae bacterium]
MKELEYKVYKELKMNNVPSAQIPKSVKNSLLFKNLQQAKILDTRRAGRGSIVFVKDIEAYDTFFNQHFSEADNVIITKASNILKLRDSKARHVESKPLFLLRGFSTVTVNENEVNLKFFTETYGLFSILSPAIKTSKICFVENLESFLKAEKLLGIDYTYVHKYGRIGIRSLSAFECNEVIVFVDYDFNGLDEYLRIKSHFPGAKLYLPDNFDELFSKSSKPIKGQQKQSKRVSESILPEVIKIRELVSKRSYFLEQEILTHD